MHRLSLLFLLGALLNWAAPIQALDCSDQAAVKNERNKCVSKYGLTAHSDVDQLQNDIRTHLSTTCKDIDKYKSVLSCATTIARNCLESTEKDPDIISDGEKVSEGLTYLCDHVEEIDSQCYKEAEASLQQCVGLRVQTELASVASDQNTTLVVCRTFEITLSCMETHLRACTGKTLEVFATYTKYFIPPACGGAQVPSSTSFLILSLVALVAFVFGSSQG